ncbi:MAG: restriction endonuclease [Bacteroidota bacterium]
MKGKHFENFIENLERNLNKSHATTIEKNVHRLTRQGSLRQIDVLLTHKIGRHSFTTIIECKDWKRKVDIKIIEEFASKLKALEADKGILVSKSGFTNGLFKEALAYPNISLYTIQEADEATKQILELQKIDSYAITYSSNDWIVRFLEKKEINQTIGLYTKLKIEDDGPPFDITAIAHDFLSQNKSFIVNKIIDADNSKNRNINAQLSLDINLRKYAFYEIDNIRTYITGFRSVVKATLKINPVKIAGVYKYQNISKNETIALVLKLNFDEGTRKLILA